MTETYSVLPYIRITESLRDQVSEAVQDEMRMFCCSGLRRCQETAGGADGAIAAAKALPRFRGGGSLVMTYCRNKAMLWGRKNVEFRLGESYIQGFARQGDCLAKKIAVTQDDTGNRFRRCRHGQGECPG